ncbi:MAG: hypothetical protein F8N39_07205 [Clostridiaceae bacterium]|nr:hypothetical protein [Clostridiaceae bacterium]
MTATVKLTIRDLSVLDAIELSRRPSATSLVRVVRNFFCRWHPLTTAQVLRSLKKLERAGRVKRVPSSYQVMLCWLTVDEDGEA